MPAEQTTNGASAFGRLWDTVVGTGVDILQARGAQYLAREQAQTQASVQRPYQDLASSSPNLGPNDNSAATRQADFQTALMQRVNPNSTGFSWIWVAGIAGVVVLVVLIFRRRK